MNVVVIGAQWGDEGKGKIVDFLADHADAIVRYSGGANAGHTIVIGGEQYALHLVPSGILYPDKTVYLGTGMVIDPEALFAELSMLEERGISGYLFPNGLIWSYPGTGSWTRSGMRCGKNQSVQPDGE